MLVNITVTEKHLDKALEEEKYRNSRCKTCLMAQALEDCKIVDFSWCAADAVRFPNCRIGQGEEYCEIVREFDTGEEGLRDSLPRTVPVKVPFVKLRFKYFPGKPFSRSGEFALCNEYLEKYFGITGDFTLTISMEKFEGSTEILHDDGNVTCELFIANICVEETFFLQDACGHDGPQKFYVRFDQ